MLDIISVPNGGDLQVADSIAPKAANVLSIQVGSLEYAQAFGVDFKYFITSDFQFQNQSFKAYLVQVLSQNQVNVSNTVDIVEALYERIIFTVGDTTATRGLL